MVRKLTSVILSLVIIMSVLVITPIHASAEETGSVNTSTSTEELEFTASNSLGTMLAAEYEDDINEEDCIGNNIYEMKVENNLANVELQVLTDAILVVALYDDNGEEMYGSGIAQVGVDDIFVDVELDVTTPEYFLVKAYLLDAETNVPLCKEYVCDTYTQTMQEFLSKTTADFDEEKVLNLDESETNNFLVYNDETILIDSNKQTNVVTSCDEENQTYVIENIDDSVSSLLVGDIFSCNYEDDDNILIIKIASITIDGTTATICGEEIALEEAFQYIRIEATQGVDENSIDNSQLEEGIEYTGTTNKEELQDTGKVPAAVGADIDEEHSSSISINFDVDKKSLGGHFKVSGSLGLEVEASIKCYYDIKWGKEDDVEFSITIKYEIAADVKIELSTASGDKDGIEIPLSYIAFCPVPAITISFTPSIVLEGSVSAELKGISTGQIGKEFKNGEFNDTSKKATFYPEFTVSGELSFGLSLKPKVSITGNIFAVSATMKQGVKICASLTYSGEEEEEYPEERHACKHCIEGEIDWYADVSFGLEILNIMSVEASTVSYTKKLTDFYYSLDNNEFDLGSCPNYEYKQTIVVLDKERNIVQGALVNGVETNSLGEAIIYLTKGKHEITIEQNNIAMLKKNITVNGAKDRVYTLKECESIWDSIHCVVAQKTATVVSSGTCSDNIEYTLYDNGTLVISGTGAMEDYSSDNESPFEGNTDIKRVIVKTGVTSIGAYTFRSCENLTKISLPTSVTSIGSYAFSSCSAIESVTLPISLTSIGSYAFAFCKGLSEITIPDSVSNIDAHAFQVCTALKSVTVPENLETIKGYTFYGCSSLEQIIIPNGVLAIEGEAFKNCTSLSSVIIPSSVMKIGEEAFKGCTNLSNATLSDGLMHIYASAFYGCSSLFGITIPDTVLSIGNNAFENCTSLNYATIGSGVTNIGTDVFYNCPDLGKIDVNSWNASYCSIDGNLYTNDKTQFIKYAPNKSDTSFVIPDGVLTIANNALYNCTNLVNVTIPDTVTKIGNYAFKNCTNLEGIILPDSVDTINYQAFNSCTNLKSVVIGNGIKYFGGYAFTDCTNLENLSIGNITTSIGANSFQRCINLKSVTIPDSVTRIEEHAFSQCTNLEKVVIGSSVTNIGNSAFYNCSNLSDLTINSNIENIGNSAFSGCESITSIVLPDSVKTIGKYAFSKCSSLTNITLGVYLTSIGEHAFQNCTYLESIIIPDSVTSINNYTFSGCSNLKNASIGNKVTSIGFDAFKDCVTLSDVTIGYSVTSIGGSAFYNCINLTQVTLPESVTSIGNSAFMGCASLQYIQIPDGLTSIGQSAFKNCSSLKYFEIPEGITSIDSYTFYECSNLQQIIIPMSVTSIGTNAFYNCLLLSTVYYGGTVEQWEQINLSNNRELLAAEIICYTSNLAATASESTEETDLVQDATNTTQENYESASYHNLKLPSGTAEEIILPNDISEEYSRTNLVPGTEAILIILEEVFEETEEDSVMNSSTLLYISQTTVDENGTATFNVGEDFSDKYWSAYIFGECSHASSHIKTVIEPTYSEGGFEICICDYCDEIIDSNDIDAIASEYPLGDVDLDGKVTVRDCSAIQKHLAGFINVSDQQLALADVNGDGSVNVIDSTEIQKYLVCLSSCFDNQ